MVKSLPAVLWETWVGKKPLEKEMATHSSILAWKIPGTEEPGRLQSMGLQRVGHDWAHLAHSPTKYAVKINAGKHSDSFLFCLTQRKLLFLWICMYFKAY